MATIKVFDSAGKEVEKLSLDLNLEKKELSPKTFSCAIKVLRQNERQGTVGSKTRGEVSFSNRKPWKQKGTGRARAGSLRSPLWRKGGTIFGPQARERTLSLNKKQGKLVFNNLFFSYVDNDAVHCLDFNSEAKFPKTKEASNALKKLGLEHNKVVLILPYDDTKNYASFRNLPNVNIIFFDQPNAFDLSNCDNWVFFKKDLDQFKTMVSQWN